MDSILNIYLFFILYNILQCADICYLSGYGRNPLSILHHPINSNYTLDWGSLRNVITVEWVCHVAQEDEQQWLARYN